MMTTKKAKESTITHEDTNIKRFLFVFVVVVVVKYRCKTYVKLNKSTQRETKN